MKIAAITDDGKTISMHFGRARHYMVCMVENGEITTHDLRDKFGHHNVMAEDHDHDHDDPRGRGFGTGAAQRHAQMVQAITDCEAVLVRGMGRGAYVAMETANIKPIVTDIPVIDDAVKAYIKGDIVDHIEKLH